MACLISIAHAKSKAKQADSNEQQERYIPSHTRVSLFCTFSHQPSPVLPVSYNQHNKCSSGPPWVGGCPPKKERWVGRQIDSTLDGLVGLDANAAHASLHTTSVDSSPPPPSSLPSLCTQGPPSLGPRRHEAAGVVEPALVGLRQLALPLLHRQRVVQLQAWGMEGKGGDLGVCLGRERDLGV